MSGRPRKMSKSDEKFLEIFFFKRREEVQQGPGSGSGSFIGMPGDLVTVVRSLSRNGLHGREAANKTTNSEGEKDEKA